jgi:hypothetical protein
VGVGVGVSGVAGEEGVVEEAGAAVGFDHEHLVGVVGVDVAVGDLGDIGVGAEGADGAAAREVAEDGFDENVAGWALGKC